MQSLEVALAQLVVERRALGKLLHFPQLHRRRIPHPVSRRSSSRLARRLRRSRFAAPQVLLANLRLSSAKRFSMCATCFGVCRRATCPCAGGERAGFAAHVHERIVTQTRSSRDSPSPIFCSLLRDARVMRQGIFLCRRRSRREALSRARRKLLSRDRDSCWHGIEGRYPRSRTRAVAQCSRRATMPKAEGECDFSHEPQRNSPR